MKTRWLPGRAALIDMALLGAAWLAIRLPLLVFHLAPLVQVDSFWQRPLPDSLSSPHAPFLYGQFVFSFGAYWGAIIQHLLVLFAGVVLYEVARRAAGRAAGLCTGLFIVLHGGFVLYAHSFMSETLFNFFLALHLGALWMALTADSGKRAAVWFFVTGVLAGVATNVRPTAQCQVLVLPLAMLPFYVRHGERLKFVRLTAALLAGFALVMVFSLGRLRFPKWPLHPVIFLIWATYPAGCFAFSFLLGWLVKATIARFGGSKVYQDLKPMMYGLIAGELVGTFVPVLIGFVYFLATGNNPQAFRVFPG